MKKAILGIVLVCGAVLALRHFTAGDSEAPAQADDSLVVNRIWIDHIPKNDRDVFQLFVAISEEPFGIFQATSQWKGAYELFRYERVGGELRVVYGQSGERETLKASGKACNQDGWDYCLELKGNSRGAKKYYSMKGWEIDGAAGKQALDLDALRTRVLEASQR